MVVHQHQDVGWFTSQQHARVSQRLSHGSTPTPTPRCWLIHFPAACPSISEIESRQYTNTNIKMLVDSLPSNMPKYLRDWVTAVHQHQDADWFTSQQHAEVSQRLSHGSTPTPRCWLIHFPATCRSISETESRQYTNTKMLIDSLPSSMLEYLRDWLTVVHQYQDVDWFTSQQHAGVSQRLSHGSTPIPRCRLIHFPATCWSISETDLPRQLQVLSFWNRSWRSNLLFNPIPVNRHQSNQSQYWPYTAKCLAEQPLLRF